MIYKKFHELELSNLGLGNMRLPLIEGGKITDIDQDKVDEMVDYAMENGINYYDTAWGYHNGQSEIALGKALKKHPRDQFYIADKFPGYDLRNMDKIEEIFEKQLEKCQVEYFDFYLVHNVCEKNIDEYLNPIHGIKEYLLKQKEDGRIKHLGFSVHGNFDTMMRFMDVYGEYMEFCQIQLNYIDWEFQDAKLKVEYLASKGIPVWVMEPVRGGALVHLEEKYETKLKNLRPDEEIVAWAFRYLQSIDNVTMILSGMSNMEQLKANIETFETRKVLTDKEKETLDEVSVAMVNAKILPCTACKYCMEKCPKELEIPNLLKLYNEHKFTGGGFLAPFAINAMPEEKRPSACVGCKSCEAVCPQNIEIAQTLKELDDMVAKSGF